MFFSPELLERRDSGFGLLWYPATLGAKSSFKKLPKRSVMTADISQLCDLIAEPSEPLALRLSSNLMIGVARVYKVKQEIFYTDVTTCFNSLKKAVQEFNSMTKGAAELQMGQPSLRPDALTIAADPGIAFAMDFDALFIVRYVSGRQDESDEEFDPKAKKTKQKGKGKERPSSVVEDPRANRYTLDEHHNLLLSGSFEAPFNATGFGGVAPSSSQFDGGFGFDDNLFDPAAMDLGDIGDDLAKELGEGWGGSPGAHHGEHLFNFAADDGGIGAEPPSDIPMAFGNEGLGPDIPLRNAHYGASPPPMSVVVHLAPLSPIRDAEGNVVRTEEQGNSENRPAQKKAKRVRLLLDSRTELTDEELKMARANYMEGQDSLRRELIQKKYEKESGKLIEEMIWGVPQGIQAPVLIDFWLENFRLQVEARSDRLHMETHGEPPTKRRRIAENGLMSQNQGDEMPKDLAGARFGNAPDFEMNLDFGRTRLTSMQEPGQARHASRPPSAVGGNFDLDIGRIVEPASGSQRSALFPWDHAGASSSVYGGAFELGRSSSAKKSLGKADVQMRGSSVGSRRESPLHARGVADSPADFGFRNSHFSGEGFEFEVPDGNAEANESQQSEANLLTLERHSFNFLEYAKMQLQTFPGSASTLSLDDVIPRATSTKRVAASAFYHCLVLATKDLITVSQTGSYGVVKITVK
ncbi:hypothetical protein OBBRIDRAFT_718943 [Obba rivulosa]|uniref:Uncharacterized protein n=1 Tax=Obba rivulosa TaxID=1052685 RepID=A0A8E2J713_9APHY|nr:hypothetical protein OBBRIDRAFT_718943 [Obba rivulosa]